MCAIDSSNIIPIFRGLNQKRPLENSSGLTFAYISDPSMRGGKEIRMKIGDLVRLYASDTLTNDDKLIAEKMIENYTEEEVVVNSKILSCYANAGYLKGTCDGALAAVGGIAIGALLWAGGTYLITKYKEKKQEKNK